MSQKHRDFSGKRDKGHGKQGRGGSGGGQRKDRDGRKGGRNERRDFRRDEHGNKQRTGGQGGSGHSRNDRDGRRESFRRRELAGMNYYIYGKHAVEAALKNEERQIHYMLATTSAFESMPILADYAYLPQRTVTTDELNILLKDESVHQGIVIEVSPLPEKSLHDIELPEGRATLVILDQVSDPHNVGAVLRSAAAFGASAVIVPEHHAAKESGVMAKAASGALERIPLVTVTNLATCMKELKAMDVWLIGLDGEATTFIGDMPDYHRVALVMGAEGRGLRRLTAENCDMLVKIPIGEAVESLNVSNAAAVALYAVGLKK